VVDRDIFKVDPMEIAQAKPAFTVFNGEVVHEAE
jgi:predicted amidohydrolase YtcJ